MLPAVLLVVWVVVEAELAADLSGLAAGERLAGPVQAEYLGDVGAQVAVGGEAELNFTIARTQSAASRGRSRSR